MYTTAKYPLKKNLYVRPSSWPPGILTFVLLLVVFVVPGPNFELAVLAVGVLIIGIKLLWRPGEVPILLFVFGYQWVQAAVQIFSANWLGIMLEDLDIYGGGLQTATLLSLLTCLIIALGLRLGAGPLNPQVIQQSKLDASANSISRWFGLYIAALLFSIFVGGFAWVIPGLAQPLLAIAQIKWAFFWMLAYASFVQTTGTKKYLVIAFCYEFVLGVSGFFSGFKHVFILTLLAYTASGIRFSIGHKIGLVLFVAILLLFGSVWSEIKEDYRAYMSRGTGQQVISVSMSERFDRLGSLIAELDESSLADGFEKLLTRLPYTAFFGAVLRTVPNVVPHSDGALWWDAVSRPFMPRLFFPNKGVVDDSALLNKYTGLGLAGAKQGTSISLGFPAETYVDFGMWLMFVPLFLLGWFGGKVYQWYLRSPKTSGILGMGLAVVGLMPLAGLETSVLKLISSIVLPVLASLVVIHFIIPQFYPWIQSRSKR